MGGVLLLGLGRTERSDGGWSGSGADLAIECSAPSSPVELSCSCSCSCSPPVPAPSRASRAELFISIAMRTRPTTSPLTCSSRRLRFSEALAWSECFMYLMLSTFSCCLVLHTHDSTSRPYVSFALLCLVKQRSRITGCFKFRRNVATRHGIARFTSPSPARQFIQSLAHSASTSSSLHAHPQRSKWSFEFPLAGRSLTLRL